MEIKENNWKMGEIVHLPREEKLLKKSYLISYSNYIGSRYICIREETEGKRGILMKVLGKADGDKIMIVDGKPFGKDDREEPFAGYNYFSYPFPRATEVMEAIDIIRGNQDLQQKFDKASMHINPDSTFWVKDTTRNMFLRKKLQVLGGRDGQLYPAGDDNEHYRITFVYFYKGNLIW